MKKIIAMIMMLLPISAFASVPELEKLANDYATTEGVTVVTLSGEMLQMAISQNAGETDANYGDMLSSLCVVQTEDAAYVKEISKRANKIIKRADLESLTEVDADGTLVRIFSRKDGDVASDLLVYVVDDSEMALVVISGKIPESMISEMTSTLGSL